MITLNTQAHGITAPKEAETRPQNTVSTPFPDLTICQAVCFDNPATLYSLSCLQMTATGLFVTWKPQVRSPSVTPPSSGHQPSPDAPQTSFLADDEFDVELYNDDPEGAGLWGGKMIVWCILSSC